MSVKKVRAFTLIEAVIVIVILGLVMITYSAFLAPQFAASSDSQYYTRSSALTQSVMTQLLATQDSDLSAALASAKVLGPTYKNINIDQSFISVVSDGSATIPVEMQQITLIIEAGNQPPITLTAFKGEYE